MPAPRLELFVMEDCPSCARARAIAARAAATFPLLEVRVVNLDEPGVHPPPTIFAAPTFLLDEQIVSLGTPDWPALAQTIRAKLAPKAAHD